MSMHVIIFFVKLLCSKVVALIYIIQESCSFSLLILPDSGRVGPVSCVWGGKLFCAIMKLLVRNIQKVSFLFLNWPTRVKESKFWKCLEKKRIWKSCSFVIPWKSCSPGRARITSLLCGRGLGVSGILLSKRSKGTGVWYVWQYFML